MSFLKSVFFGSEGSYNVFGMKVKFQNELPPDFIRPNAGLHGAGVVSQLAYKCLSSHIFHRITQLHTHVFVHEMGHALSAKILTGHNSEVEIVYRHGVGVTRCPLAVRDASDWKKTVIDAAGPMGDIAFATCKLVAATALKSYLSWPVAVALGSGAVISMFGELLDAYGSASKKDDGDFGGIAGRGNTHLALASTALVSQVALGIFAAIKLAA